jgi:hypothetical protein
MGLETRCGRGLITSKLNTIINWVVSLDSVYGGKHSFDAHLVPWGVQHGLPQQWSTMGKGTGSARQGRRRSRYAQ